MSIENVRRIINEMKKEPMGILGELEDTSTPTILATDKQIETEEMRQGIKFPESYKTFLKEYANGDIYLFGKEPLVSVGLNKGECMGNMSNGAVSMGWYPKYEYERDCYIFPWNRSVKLKQLFTLTYGDSNRISNDQWVFICDKEYPNNDYPVGFLTQTDQNIVCVLENFEKWLEIFWAGNKKAKLDYEPVFYLLYPDYDDYMELIDGYMDSDFKSFKGRYKEIRAKNDANFREYGITDGK